MIPEQTAVLDIDAAFAESRIGEIFSQLDADLIGLAPVKTRIREIAALLLVDRLRSQIGLATEPPPLHMSFTGGPGTGKTTVAMVGQYIGHTAPKTREVIKRAKGGVLFIDEAYYLYKAENERDYRGEAIEILLQAMENDREDLVFIFAGYKDRMEQFFSSNPGLKSRVGSHVDFPDYPADELLQITDLMLERLTYRFGADAREVSLHIWSVA